MTGAKPFTSTRSPGSNLEPSLQFYEFEETPLIKFTCLNGKKVKSVYFVEVHQCPASTSDRLTFVSFDEYFLFSHLDR